MAESSQVPSPQSVEALYTGHHGWLLGRLRARLGNSADAADLAHDTFLRILNQDTRRILREPRAFLSTVANGILANFYRRRDIEQAFLRTLQAMPQAQVPSLETRALMLETLVDIDRRLSSLPAPVKQAFLLAQVDGLKQAEIARELHVSLPTVQRYLSRAMLACFF